MPLAIVPGSTNKGSFLTATANLPFLQPTTPGNLLALVMGYPRTTGVTTNSLSSVTTAGFSQAVEVLRPEGVDRVTDGLALYFKPSGAGESSIDVSMTAARKVGWWLAEISGQAASPLDKVNESSPPDDVQSINTGATGVLDQANEILLGAALFYDDQLGPYTWGSGFTEFGATLEVGGSGADLSLMFGYKIVSATTSENPAASIDSGTADALACIATFKDADPGGGGGGGLLPTLLQHG